jgi:hypothetical protein
MFTNAQSLRDFIKNRKGVHCWVTFFARKLIEKFTNKNDDNGYIVLEEAPIWCFSLSGKETRPDAMIIEVYTEDKIVVIIECKTYENEFGKGKDQIRGYMRDLGCGHGVLMNVDKAITFRLDTNDEIVSSGIIDLSKDGGLNELIAFVNEAE